MSKANPPSATTLPKATDLRILRNHLDRALSKTAEITDYCVSRTVLDLAAEIQAVIDKVDKTDRYDSRPPKGIIYDHN